MRFFLVQAALAAIHGGCMLLALSPFDIWPLGIAAVMTLLPAASAVYRAPWKRVWLSWLLFSLATTFITFHWIIGTIHRYTGAHLPVTAVLSILYAMFFQGRFLLLFVVARFVSVGALRNLPGMLFFSVLVSAADALMPELFPWSWGNAVAAFGPLRQYAAIGSVYLVSLVTGFIGIVLYLFAAEIWRHRVQSALRIAAVPLVIVMVTVIMGSGLYYFPLQAGSHSLRTLVVQTNIGAAPEDKRSDKEFATEAINRLFNQTLEGLVLHGSGVDLIVWPEAAMPFHSAAPQKANGDIYSPTFDASVEYLSRRSGGALVFHDMYRESTRLHSRLSLRPEWGVDNQYLKRRLVPWGEYLPLEGILPQLRHWFPEAGHFHAASQRNEIVAQSGSPVLPLRSAADVAADLPFLADGATVRSRVAAPAYDRRFVLKPLICYEALYPADARTRQADIIVNLASDAWFGDGIEGHQHASAAMVRAVENGIPMVRAAMSGISAVVDAKGDDLVPRTGQARAESLYAEIPLGRRRTVFSRFGMAAFWAIAVCLLWPWLLNRFIAARTAENK